MLVSSINFLRTVRENGNPHTMPRNRWQAPGTEWVQILRGPRPPSVKWPKAGQQQQRQTGGPSHPAKGQNVPIANARVPRQSLPGPMPPPLRQVSKPPEKIAADAIGEIQRLQAAITALGDSTALVKPLQEALRAAQTEASVLPVQERVESCKLFLERARKRVQRAQEVIDRACEQKALYEAEVVEGEARLAKLEAEAANVPTSVLSREDPMIGGQMPGHGEIAEMRRELEELRQFRDRFPAAAGNDVVVSERAPGSWTVSGPPCFENVPPIPSSDIQDLAAWLSQRNCDLQTAIKYEDPGLVAKIGGLVGQGASLLSTMEHNLPDDERSRSAPGEGRFAPY